jgi:hypothetical protein
MWCAHCGSEMKRREDGAWPRCCDGQGYWTREAPLARDRWYPHTEAEGFHAYLSANWPAGVRPVLPE